MTPWGVPIPERGYGPGSCPPCVGWGTLSLGAACQWCNGTGQISDEALQRWLEADFGRQHDRFVELMRNTPGGEDAMAYATAAMLKLDAGNIIRATKKRRKH